MNDLEDHSMSSPFLPFDRYDFLLVFHCKCISILHRFRDINICQKVNASRDLDHADLGDSLSLQD